MNTLGTGWQELIDELRQELQELDPEARVFEPRVDADGFLRFRARFSPQVASAGKALLRKYEERGRMTCELCGGSGRVYAGPVLLVRCRECVED